MSDSLHPPPAFLAKTPEKVTQQFIREVRDSVNHAMQFRPYRVTHVIAFHWENDKMNVQQLESDLLRTFRNKYGFQTTSFKIPLVESHLKLMNRLCDWSRERQGDDVLRIFVYSGHADVVGLHVTEWNLAGRSDHHSGMLLGPKIDWWSIRRPIEQYSGHSCYIFDCCSGGTGALRHYDGAEFMAARAWEQNATADPRFSFTKILIDTLNSLGGRPPTFAAIYSQIFRHAQTNRIGACPVHVPKTGSCSVTIGRSMDSQRITRSMEQNSYRVLISVKVRGDVQQDPAQWSAWLTQNIPKGILSTDVVVEGAFQGSGLVLLTVPIEVWTMMPRNDTAYKFIAHVSSCNILKPARPTALPIRSPPPSGKENVQGAR